MRSNRRVDTGPEVRLRSALHRRGLRFRKDFRITVRDGWVRPDVVFTRRHLSVFVDGCFWHRCPTHGRMPSSNTDYWVPKLARNVERDRWADAALRAAGWDVMRLWEHVSAEEGANRVAAHLSQGDGSELGAVDLDERL